MLTLRCGATPCVAPQVIAPDNLVGYMEQPKASNITKVFEDAYKSPLSIVILVSGPVCD